MVQLRESLIYFGIIILLAGCGSPAYTPGPTLDTKSTYIPMTTLTMVPVLTETPMPELPISIFAPDCEHMIEPTGSSISLRASNTDISSIEWNADRGRFSPKNAALSTYYPGAPGPVTITASVHFRDNSVYTATKVCQIQKSLYTATSIPITPTATPTVAFTPSPTNTITPTSTATPTFTFTPKPTPVAYKLINCASNDLWTLDPPDQVDVTLDEKGCAFFSHMRMYVKNGITISWKKPDLPQQSVAYNIYFKKRLIAPTTIQFKVNLYEMDTLPKVGSDVSLFAGFVNGTETSPNWIVGGKPLENGQGSFAILRVAGAVVKRISNSKTKYLLYQNWLGDFGNITQKFEADDFGLDFKLIYRDDGIDMLWKPENEEKYLPLSDSLYKPDPAYFVIGYILPKDGSLVAWISDISVNYGGQ